MSNIIADEARNRGNDAYKSKKFRTAIKCYTESIRFEAYMTTVIEAVPTQCHLSCPLPYRDYEDDAAGIEGKVMSFTNRALVYSNQKDWEACAEDCNQALSLDSTCFKARHRRATAFQQLKVL
jgi:hypothetical protein